MFLPANAFARADGVGCTAKPGTADGRLGSKRESLLYRQMSASASSGHNAAQRFGSVPLCEPPPSPPNELEWTEVRDKSWIRFKSHGYTYEQPRVTAKLIEEVDKGDAHHILNGKIRAGKQRNENETAWYEYKRDAGSELVRYVVADNTELR